MSTTNDLLARLPEHAAAHEELAAHYEPPAAHQAQWAKDLRDAAAKLELMQWRDIATAPRSARQNFNAWVVAEDGSEWFEQDCYIDGENTIRDRFGVVVNGPSQRATHWMPAISGPKGEYEMSVASDLPGRLLEHAAIHDAATSPYDDEQAHWARDLREAAAQLELSGWRDIATAPTDGLRVLLATPSGKIADGYWSRHYKVWSWPYVMVNPTHWMPAPSSPAPRSA